MSFGDRLQELRRENGMTQEDFAQQLSVSRQAVSKWESSRGYPELEKIIFICNNYGVTMDELFRDELPSAGHPEPSRDANRPFLKSPPLKKAFGNFFTNLSPQNQLIFGAFLAAIILFVLLLFGFTKGDTDVMIPKFVWLGLLILFGVGEAITVGLTSIWFAGGALAGLIVSLLGGPVWLQIVLFLVISALCLVAVRPLAQKYLAPRYQPTNADRIIGAEAVVTEEIHNLKAQGAVTVAGMTWSARSTGEALIPVGTIVRVERIEGVKVFVSKLKEEVKC